MDDFNLDRQLFKEFEPKHLCNAWVATAIVGSAVVGGVASSLSANKAAEAQQYAADKASETSLSMYNRTREDLAPFRQIGIDANAELQSKLPFLTSPIVMDEENLRKTPGYQFDLREGLKAVQNSAAARGLGVSGAALKGAATFATGLADKTYQNQFNLENTNRTNAFTRLKALIDTGQSAAAQTGTAGTNAANVAAQAQIGAGDATAAGYNRVGNTISNSATNIGGYMMYKGLYGDKTNPFGTGVGGEVGGP